MNQAAVIPPEFESILENLKEIQYKTGEALAKYRKPGDKAEIMAVTKTVPPEKINFAVSQGIVLLGENRGMKSMIKILNMKK